ncbi:hypothetical protein H7I01_02305, partial [Mycobacterium palustre]|nr:hypothetical protein [Mycobacterium palustre]
NAANAALAAAGVGGWPRRKLSRAVNAANAALAAAGVGGWPRRKLSRAVISLLTR